LSRIVAKIRLRLKRLTVRHTFHALREEMVEGLTAMEIEKVSFDLS